MPDLELAAELAQSCYELYRRTPAGLAPEIAHFNEDAGMYSCLLLCLGWAACLWEAAVLDEDFLQPFGMTFGLPVTEGSGAWPVCVHVIALSDLSNACCRLCCACHLQSHKIFQVGTCTMSGTATSLSSPM